MSLEICSKCLSTLIRLTGSIKKQAYRQSREGESPNFAVSQYRSISNYYISPFCLTVRACCVCTYTLTGQVSRTLQQTQLYLQECARIAYSRALDFRWRDATLVNYILRSYGRRLCRRTVHYSSRRPK